MPDLPLEETAGEELTRLHTELTQIRAKMELIRNSAAEHGQAGNYIRNQSYVELAQREYKLDTEVRILQRGIKNFLLIQAGEPPLDVQDPSMGSTRIVSSGGSY